MTKDGVQMAKANSRKYGWLARQSMSLRVVLTSLLVTVLVMGAIAVVLAEQSQAKAQETVRREMRAALAAVDQSLQLVFNSASQRGRELMPAFISSLGGEPTTDGSMTPTGEAGNVPSLLVNGFVVNGDTSALKRLHDYTGADPAIIVRAKDGWVRAATLLEDDKGQKRIGSKVAPNDFLAKTLDSGQDFSGLVQRKGKWYAMSVQMLHDKEGKVIGGLSIRVDVDGDVQRLLNWVSTLKVGDYGSLAILRQGADGGGWEFVAGGGAMMGAPLSSRYNEADSARLAAMFKSADGFAEAAMKDGEAFVAWHGVENWNWLLVGTGQRDEFMAASRRDMWIQLGMMLVGIVLIAGLVGWLASATLRPVREMIAAMIKVGEGDLTADLPAVPTGSRNEVHILFDSLRHMQANLSNTVIAVRHGVEEISIGSREIAAGNTDLSSRTEEQAASLQETAASMEQLAATVRQNAESSQQANKLAGNASEIAGRGGAAVDQVVATMSDISQSSHKIADIVNVIEGIAFQTNILALNAAVEAARAGDEGKGFAVVAGEVRSLALRSAEAAKEIKQLIDESVGKVTEGAQHVERAGATMREILASVRQVTGIMAEISAASDEQSTGIDQVNTAVVQMDQVTQQNAALVEEAAAAAGSLQEQVQNLAQAVSVFRLKSTEIIEAPQEVLALT